MLRRRSASLATWRRDAVRRMRASRQATIALLARLPAREIVRPGTQDRWSVKDVLAHLLSCDEETAVRFRLIERGQGDRIHWFRDMADADRFNGRAVARLRRLSVPVLRRRLERTRADLIARFQRLPDDALRDSSHEYTVVQWLPAPGWTHEREHLQELRVWWREQSGVRPELARERLQAADTRRGRSRPPGRRRASPTRRRAAR